MEEFNFKPYDKVLVRDFDSEEWRIEFFSRIIKQDDEGDGICYGCIGDVYFQCIPYEDNKHLLGTNEPYMYRPQKGEIVLLEDEVLRQAYFAVFNYISQGIIYIDACYNVTEGKLWLKPKQFADTIKIKKAKEEEKIMLISLLNANGVDYHHMGESSSEDLQVVDLSKPKKSKGWINIVRGQGASQTHVGVGIYATEQEARDVKFGVFDKIATIHIEWEE